MCSDSITWIEIYLHVVPNLFLVQEWYFQYHLTCCSLKIHTSFHIVLAISAITSYIPLVFLEITFISPLSIHFIISIHGFIGLINFRLNTWIAKDIPILHHPCSYDNSWNYSTSENRGRHTCRTVLLSQNIETTGLRFSSISDADWGYEEILWMEI